MSATEPLARLTLQVEVEKWLLKSPFRITGYTFPMTQVVTVTLERDGLRGLGEAAGVYYHGDTIQSLAASIESARRQIEAGISHESLPAILQRTGARNAVEERVERLFKEAQSALQGAGLTPEGQKRLEQLARKFAYRDR